MLLEQMLGSLNTEERELIYLRFFKESTQTSIAQKMGMSQVQVSRMGEKDFAKNAGSIFFRNFQILLLPAISCKEDLG